jgi:polyferredoxin
MEKMNYPKGLIRYSTEHAIEKGWGSKEILKHVLRPRTLIYTSVLCLIIIGFIWGIASRTPVRMDVIRDRGTLAREVEDGMIENVYSLRVMNASETAREVKISVTGIDGIKLLGDTTALIEPNNARTLSVRAQAPGDAVPRGSHRIFFDLHTADNKIALHEKSTFLMQ